MFFNFKSRIFNTLLKTTRFHQSFILTANAIGATTFTILNSPRIECSPTFAGVPVAATFLMHQSFPIFAAEFPGLEMSALFNMNNEEFSFEEHFNNIFLRILGPSEASIVVPVFEKLSNIEEERMGTSGIKKSPVGKLKMWGECKLGCAKVELCRMELYKTDGDIVWTWTKSQV